MSTDLFPQAHNQRDLEREPRWLRGFNADGLIVAVAQHADPGEILMLAWMNAEALKLNRRDRDRPLLQPFAQRTLEEGETSGQLQDVIELRVDCDQDAVLLKVRPRGDGGACHVGFRSCFYRVREDGQLVERDAPPERTGWT